MATIWHRRRAGKFYDEYYSRAVAKGVQPLELEQVRINPENLNIIQKLIGADTEAGDELIEKLLRKEVTYTDLRLMWHSVREKNTGTRRKNGYDSVSYSFNNYEFESKVILALKNSAWLLGKKTAKLDGRQYKLLQGIKIDGLEAKPNATIIEAVNPQEEVKLHFVQIQTRLEDNSPLELLNSYVADLGDYIWLVLPQEEVRRARDLWDSYAWRSVGIIGYAEETEKLTIYKPAEPCTAAYEFERRMRKLDAVVKYLL